MVIGVNKLRLSIVERYENENLEKTKNVELLDEEEKVELCKGKRL